jgi:MtN3 and saliva related transmembrane protein
MKFKILDSNVSLTMNVFLVIANIINIVYNLPQVIKTYKTRSTKDFSEWFLFLRVIGNIIWVAYSVEVDSLLMLINNLVTVLASIFIGYYKIKEIIDSKRKNIYNQICNGNDNGNDNGDEDEDGNKNKYYNNGSDNILILYEKMESINISV